MQVAPERGLQPPEGPEPEACMAGGTLPMCMRNRDRMGWGCDGSPSGGTLSACFGLAFGLKTESGVGMPVGDAPSGIGTAKEGTAECMQKSFGLVVESGVRTIMGDCSSCRDTVVEHGIPEGTEKQCTLGVASGVWMPMGGASNCSGTVVDMACGLGVETGVLMSVGEASHSHDTVLEHGTAEGMEKPYVLSPEPGVHVPAGGGPP